MRYRFLLPCLLLWLVSIRSSGQGNPATSLSDLWEQAFANYPSLEAYQARLRQADYQKKLVRNQYLPQVLLQAQNTMGTNQSVGGAFFPLPGIYNIGGSGDEDPGDLSANLFGSITVNWEFLQFGKQKKSLEATEILTRQIKHRLEVEQLIIQEELTRAYFQLLYHRQMQRWAKENNNRLKSLFDASTSIANAGLSPGADSLLVKASLKETQSYLSEWEGRREESELLLAMWINSSPDQLNLKDEGFPELYPSESSQTEFETNFSHPLMASGYEQIQYEEKLRELEFANIFPSLSLLAGVQLRGHSTGIGEPLRQTWKNSYSHPLGNHLVGVGLSWNVSRLFDFKINDGRYREKIAQKEAEMEEISLNLKSRQQIAGTLLKQNREQLKHTNEAFSAAKEAYRLFESRYNSGLISITDLLQIQDILQRTEKSKIEAYYQYWIHQVDMAASKADFSLLQNVFD